MMKFNILYKRILPVALITTLVLALSAFAMENGIKLLRLETDTANDAGAFDATKGIMIRYNENATQSLFASTQNSTKNIEQKVIVTDTDNEKISSQIHVITVDDDDIHNHKDNKNIDYAEIDFRVRKSSLDEYWNMSEMEVPMAHRLPYRGGGVKIALLDTGVDLNTSDYHVAGGISFVDNIDSYADDNGHGTAMASIMAGDALGIAPKAEVYAVKVLDNKGEGKYSNVIQGIYWAIEQNVDIINMSFGASEYSLFLEEAIEAATNAGITLIAAAGNMGDEKLQYPARYSRVIGVGASDKNGEIAEYSNMGDGLNILAPGEDIQTLSVNGFGITTKGTSVSAAQVAGVTALLRSAKEDLTPLQTLMVLARGSVSTNNMEVGVINVWNSLSRINAYIENPEDYILTFTETIRDIVNEDGIFQASYKYDGYDYQTINPGQPVTVRAGFNSYHDYCDMTVYNVNSPSTIIYSERRHNIYGDAYVTFTCPSGYLNNVGTYNIRYHASGNGSNTEWDDVFTVYVAAFPADSYEPNNSISSAREIYGDITARISSNEDKDYYKVYAYAGDIITANLSGIASSTANLPKDYDVELYRPITANSSSYSFVLTNSVVDGLGYENFTYTVPVDGYYIFNIYSWYGLSSNTQYRLSVSVTSPPKDDYEEHYIYTAVGQQWVLNNDTYGNATPISIVNQKYIDAMISTPIDKDWYEITAPQGWLTIALYNLPSNCNYDLYLFASNPNSSESNWIARSWSGGNGEDEQISYYVNAGTQTLKILVKAFDGNGDGLGDSWSTSQDYWLDIFFGLKIQPPNLKAENITKNSAKVSWAMPFTGNHTLNYGDNYSMIDTPKTQNNTSQPNINLTSLSNATRYYYRANSMTTGSPVTTIQSERQEFVTGDQYESNDVASTSLGTVASGSTLEATIHHLSDVDFYRLPLTVPGRATITLSNIPAGCDYDVFLCDSNGIPIANNTKNGTASETIIFNIETPSTYYIKVDAFDWVDAKATSRYSLYYSYSPFTYTYIYPTDELHFGGNGTYTATGNFAHSYNDLMMTNSAFDYAIGRTYNSKDAVSTHFGHGWLFSVEGRVTDLERKLLWSNGNITTETDTTRKMVKLPDGSQYIFKIESGAYIAQDSRNKLIKNSDNTFTFTMHNQNQYVFNSNGYLTTIRDKHDNSINISVNSSGKVQNFTDSVGNVYTVSYNSNGFISGITEQVGGTITNRSISYGYTNNRLTSATDAMGIVTYYNYDSDGYLSEIRNHQNKLIEKIEYVSVTNEPKKVWKHTNEFGNVVTYTYTPAQNKTTTIDTNGRTTEFSYDDKKFITSEKDALDRTVTTQYFTEADGTNKYGEIQYRIDENGNKTTYERDLSGNITKEIHPDGTFKEWHYDSKNNVDWDRNETGQFTIYQYNANKDRLVKKAKYLLPLATGVVDLTSSNKDLFTIEEYEYYPDSTYKIKSLLNKYKNALGVETIYTYDVNGNPQTVKDPETQQVTTYEYNGYNLKTADITPLGYRTEYLYDKNNNLVKTTEITSGAVKRIVYDENGRKVQEISPKQYDASKDNLTTFAYSNSSVGMRYEYNSNGSLKKTTTPEGDTTEILEYDGYGNIKRESLPRQYDANDVLQNDYAQYIYEYDNINRVTKRWVRETENTTNTLLEQTSYSIVQEDEQYFSIETTTINHNPGLSSTVEKKFNYAKLLVLQTNPDNSTIEKSYYGDGKVLSEKDGRNHTTYYKYNTFDEDNSVIYDEVWKPIEGGYAYSRVSYDKVGQKVSEKIGLSVVERDVVPASFFTTNYEYYNNGKLKKSFDSEGRRVDYWYDNDGGISKEEVYVKAAESVNPAVTNVIEYVNNSIGKVYQKKQHINSTDLFNDSRTILVAETLYDLNGNPQTITTPDGEVTNYVFDNQNRQTSVTQTITGEDGSPTIATVEKKYNATDEVRYSKDANGNETTVVFNTRGFPVNVIDADGTSYAEYDLSGRLVAEVKPKFYSPDQDLSQMNRTEYVYDNMSLVENKIEKYKVDDEWINTTVKTFTYTANGDIETEMDALNNTTTYTYTPDNQVKTIKDPVTAERGLDYTYSYTYNALGQKESETNAKGVVIKFYYDYLGNQTAKKLVVGATEQQLEAIGYDLVGNPISKTDGNGNVTQISYNAFNLPRNINMPSDETISANTIQHKYDGMGNLVWQQDSAGVTTMTDYDERGKILSQAIQNADGTESVTILNRYDSNGNIRFATDGNGNTTENTYDGKNRLLTQSLAGKTTTYHYDANGNNDTITDWLNNVVSTEYDPLDRISVRKDAFDKPIETLTYYDNGLQWKSMDALGNTTEYQYDKNTRLVKTIDPLLNETSQTYDNVGNIDTKTDGEGNVQSLYYDALNRLDYITATVNDVTETTNYDYDWQGNQTTLTDGEGNVTTTLYNARNLPKLKYDDGGEFDSAKQECYKYYADGLLHEKTDRNGLITEYVYYPQGWLRSQTVADESIAYTYDGNGNQLTITDSTGTTTRLYDAFNRTYSKTQPNVGTFSYQYDVTQNLVSGHHAELTTDPKGNITKKIFDQMGRLYQIFDCGETIPTEYCYYYNGSLQWVQYANGTREEYSYYDNGKLETLINKNPNGETQDIYSHTYDRAGNQTSKTEIVGGVSKGTTSYTYDELNRLKNVTEPSGKDTAYTYDKAGNRKTETVTVSGSNVLTTYNYNEQNRLTDTIAELGDVTVIHRYYYDNNGNQYSKTKETLSSATGSESSSVSLTLLGETEDEISKYVHLYEYNGFNKMTTAYVGETKTNYTYNGEGLRVSKTSNGTTTYYGYEYDKVVLELIDGNQSARNLYGLNLISRTAESQTLFYQFNGHADVTALTDSNGTVIASYYYDAFGVTLESNGTSDNPFRYAGYEFDDETGLYYLKTRFYDAKIARFTQMDIYQGSNNDPLSLNLYTYVLNNPLRYDDPLGMAANDVQRNPNSTRSQLYKGKLIIFVHGLNGDATAFQDTVANLKRENNINDWKYMSIGIITAGRGNNNGPYYTGSDQAGIYYNDEFLNELEYNYGKSALQNPDAYLPREIDILTGQGINLMVRVEFSSGVLSFDEQYNELYNMLYPLEGHQADVAFIGHSMGGLANINYASDYAQNHPGKRVSVITVDTPYHENKWAAAAWRTKKWDEDQGAYFAFGQRVGEANQDLGGVGSDAMDTLRNKWNNYKEGGGTVVLYAINTSMYDPHDGRKGDKEYNKTHEKNWSDKGDGVVDIPSQQGQGWNNVNVQDMIIGSGKGKVTPAQDLVNYTLYHHVNITSRTEVSRQISNILKR